MKNQELPRGQDRPDPDDTVLFGVHYMIDGYGASPAALEGKVELERFLVSLAQKLGMHAIAEPKVVEVGPKNQKDPGGVSGFLLIAESHISFHTFPRRGFITLDMYTCQDTLDTKSVKASVFEFFSLTDCEEHLVKRGTRYPSRNI
jgi:S-adenosylmethionine decarboxylase